MGAAGRSGSQALLMQLLEPANRANPYPVYASLSRGGPIQLTETDLIVFSTARECDDVLRHPSSSSDRRSRRSSQRNIQALIDAGNEPRRQRPPGFLFLDPPDHTRLRKLVSKAFAPKSGQRAAPHIAALVDGLLDRIADRGRFDVVEDFAYPLPVAVICRLLGVPIDDEPQFSHASGAARPGAGPVHVVHREPSDGLRSASRRPYGCANTSTV